MMDFLQFFNIASRLPRYLTIERTPLGADIFNPAGKQIAHIPISKSQKHDALTLLELIEALPDLARGMPYSNEV